MKQNDSKKRARRKDLLVKESDIQLEYICCISGDLYYYYSKPVPRFHFTSPWYNKRTTH